MTITAEQIVQRMNEAFNCAEAASPEDAAQSILDTTRAEATAAAYGAAANSLLECSVWCDSQERTDDGWHNGVVDARKHHMQRITALTPADATAWLAARDAAMIETGWRAMFEVIGVELPDPWPVEEVSPGVTTPVDPATLIQAAMAAQFKAGQEAARKGAVKGWAVVRADGSSRAAYSVGEAALRGAIRLPGETIRPCLILVGEGE